MANHSLKNCIEDIIKKLNSTKGEVFAEICAKWLDIAGAEFAKSTLPVDIRYFKTSKGKDISLVLKLDQKADMLQIQFSESIIIERINTYFGYKAITKLKFKN